MTGRIPGGVLPMRETVGRNPAAPRQIHVALRLTGLGGRRRRSFGRTSNFPDAPSVLGLTWSFPFLAIWLLRLGAFGRHTRRVNATAPRRFPRAIETEGVDPATKLEDSREFLRRAETLGIPWQRILREEIHAEQTLR